MPECVSVSVPKVSIHAPGRGATLWMCTSSSKSFSFNSRTREGCDSGRPAFPSGGFGFNSRTREGCDRLLGVFMVGLLGFNSRTREGCDFQQLAQLDDEIRFNSRTREGCDPSYSESYVR